MNFNKDCGFWVSLTFFLVLESKRVRSFEVTSKLLLASLLSAGNWAFLQITRIGTVKYPKEFGA